MRWSKLPESPWFLGAVLCASASVLASIVFFDDGMYGNSTPHIVAAGAPPPPKLSPPPMLPVTSATQPKEDLAAQLDAYLLRPTPAAREVVLGAMKARRDETMALLSDRARGDRVATRLRELIELALIVGGPRALPLLVELGDRTDLAEEVRSVLVREVARSRSPAAMAVLIDWYAPKHVGFVSHRGQLIDAAISVGLEVDLPYLVQRASREAEVAQREACLCVKSGIEAKLRSQQAALAIENASGSELIEKLSRESASWVRLNIVKKLGSEPNAAAVAALASCLPSPPGERLDTVELNALVELVRVAEDREDARLAVSHWVRTLDDNAARTSVRSVLGHYGGPGLARELRAPPPDGPTPEWLAEMAARIESRVGAPSNK